MNTTKFVVLILCMVLYSIVHAAAAQPEVLLGITTDLDKGEITIEVASSGCTTKADFCFEYKDQVLTVIRKQRDTCKAMPEKIRLTFKLKDVGVDPNTPFRISNAFVVNENSAHFMSDSNK
jgi:hypothetical protein